MKYKNITIWIVIAASIFFIFVVTVKILMKSHATESVEMVQVDGGNFIMGALSKKTKERVIKEDIEGGAKSTLYSLIQSIESYASLDAPGDYPNNMLDLKIKSKNYFNWSDLGWSFEYIEFEGDGTGQYKIAGKLKNAKSDKWAFYSSDSREIKFVKKDPQLLLYEVIESREERNSRFEWPGKSVMVNSFRISKYEVTQKDWERVMKSNPSKFKSEKRPIEKISWHDAVKFCNKLSEMDGFKPVYTISKGNVTCDFTKNGYRLPTEAEWEYAARGGAMSKDYDYSGSHNADIVAWYDVNSGGQTHNVGTKQPNELGLYDMSGNVFELCWDWYDEKYFIQSPSKNPRGPSSGTYRVLRGGSWVTEDEVDLMVIGRNGVWPSFGHECVGFRLARTASF